MRCATCPVKTGGCLGQTVPRLCMLARTREDYRDQLVVLAREAASGEGRPPSDPRAALSAIARCPNRGGVLPHALQPECGCAELTECRAGRGRTPRRVTTADCLACVKG